MNPFERIYSLGFQQIIPIGWMKCPAEKISYWIGHPVQLDKTSPLALGNRQNQPIQIQGNLTNSKSPIFSGPTIFSGPANQNEYFEYFQEFSERRSIPHHIGMKSDVNEKTESIP
jgi:hypothetical protein